MNHLIRACSVLLLGAGAALAQQSEFRDSRLARIDDPLRVEFTSNVDLAALRQAIAATAPTNDWQVIQDSAGQFDLARRIASKHSMGISLAYNAHGYTIRYVDSINMLYNDKAVNMRGYSHRAIHKNYNIWIRQLADAINTAAGATAMVSSGAQRSAGAGKDGTFLPATLPERIEIVPPGPDAAPKAAAYSGQWAGTWGSSLQHILVVERVEGHRATVLFCWGTSPSIKEPGCSHETAAVDEEGVLRGKWKNGAQVSYRASADGRSLRGEYDRNGRLTHGTFEKVAR